MIPMRSVAGKSAVSVFFEEINDLDIYIEDTAHGYEKIYAVLFSRVFDGKHRVGKVFPLGSRETVINEFNNQIEGILRPSLFVIDGDLFILVGDSVTNKKGLFKLPFYCVENALCDKDAISSILFEEDPVKDQEDLSNEFNYDDWVIKNEQKLFDLFIEYAITFSVNPTEKTVTFPVNKLVSSDSGNIDDNKLDNRIQYLRKEAIDKVGIVQYEFAKRKILINLDGCRASKLDLVSGKDYLLPLLKSRFKSIVKTRIPDINLKLRLALKCNIDKIRESELFIS